MSMSQNPMEHFTKFDLRCIYARQKVCSHILSVAGIADIIAMCSACFEGDREYMFMNTVN